jgi:hypothetical protein
MTTMDDPIVLVDLDTATDVNVDDRVTIGVATTPLDDQRRNLASRLDLTLVPPETETRPPFVAVADPHQEAEKLTTANPMAALVLAHVLRAQPSDIPAALDLES